MITLTQKLKAQALEAYVRSVGVQPSSVDDRDIVFTPRVQATANRLVRDDIFPRVEDQGNVGRCTGETMTTIAEAILNTARPYQPGIHDLSPQFNYFYSRKYDGSVGDVGASPRSMCRSAKNYGICTEALWPDASSVDVEPDSAARNYALTQRLGQYEVIEWNKDNPHDLIYQVESAMAEGLLVAFAFFCKRWMFYIDGPLGSAGHSQAAMGNTDPMNEIVGGHIVPLMGYDRSLFPASGGSMIAQNSWGTDWGAGGLWSINYMQFIAPSFAMEVRVFRDFAEVSIAPPIWQPLTLEQIVAYKQRLADLGLNNFASASATELIAAWEALRRFGCDAAQAAQVTDFPPSSINMFLAAHPALVAAWKTF